jgi:DNA repair protein RadD
MRFSHEVLRILRALDPGPPGVLLEEDLLEVDPDIDLSESTRPGRRERIVSLIRDEERPSFFDYQTDLMSRMVQLLQLRESALLSLPTGAGKTRTAIAAVLEARRLVNGFRACWLAPTYELLDQALSTAIELWRQTGAAPDINIALAGEPERQTDLWLTTPQAVASKAKRRQSLGMWHALIFDEAHQMTAPTFRAAAEALRARSGVRAVVGLSATPGRAAESEMEALIDLFDGHLLTSRLLGAHPVEELQRRGVLSQLRFRRLSGRPAPSLDDIERLRVIVRACRYLSRRGRRVLVFTSSVAAAHALTVVLRRHDVKANWVSGDLPASERRARISSFATGMTQVLANQHLLAVGYDCPAVTDVIMQSKVSSSILFEQIVGRAARGPLTGGSRVASVWEFEDHLALHGLPQSYYRYRDYDWDSGP